MPRSALSRASAKRTCEPSLEDDKPAIAVTTNTVDASNAPPRNKRPRRAAALKAETKMEVKEEEEDIISPISPLSTAPAVKPEPKLALEASARRGRRKTTQNATPVAEPSTTPISRDCQEVVEGPSDEAPAPSQAPSETPKGANKGPSSALKKAREEKWKQWCEARKWIRQNDPGYQQKVGNREAHRSDAISYYRLMAYEIDTIPYIPFPNKHNPNSFGRSYNNSNLRTLVSRKFAYLAGLDEQINPETKEVEFLKEGWKLFEADTKGLEDAMREKNKVRKP